MSQRPRHRAILPFLAIGLLLASSLPATAETHAAGGAYAMTNASGGNAVVAYRRGGDGTLSLIGEFATGGTGTGRTRLSTQGSVTLTDDHRWLLVTNVGSDDVSVFSIAEDATPTLVERVPSGGDAPASVTVHGSLVYVLNTGSDRITGFRLDAAGQLTRIPGSDARLSQRGADAAQVQFNPDGTAIVVTEKATNRIDTYVVRENGRLRDHQVFASSGQTPFGLAFSGTHFVVTEAQLGIPGAATASSYSLAGDGALTLVSGSVRDFRDEVCWTAISADGRYAYVTNFGSGDISSYEIAAGGNITLLHSIAATTSAGFGPRDEDFSDDGTYLYVIDILTKNVHAYAQNADGTLTSVGAFAGLPATVAGMAAY